MVPVLSFNVISTRERHSVLLVNNEADEVYTSHAVSLPPLHPA
jgi:hypothetical protein